MFTIALFVETVNKLRQYLKHVVSVVICLCNQDRINKINYSRRVADGKEAIEVKKSDEEVVELMKALLGLIPPKVSNANTINVGQMEEDSTL